MRALLIPAICVASIMGAGCDLGSKYAAEVGWRENGSEKWNISGDFDSLDDCRSAAIAKFNSINARNPGQAFSWACLKKNSSGGYQSRHR